MTGLTAREEQLRHEGMLDAVTLLAMRGQRRGLTVESLLEQLGTDLVPAFTEADARRSLRRWKARSAALRGASPREVRRALQGDAQHPARPPRRLNRPIEEIADPQHCPQCPRILDGLVNLSRHIVTAHTKRACPVCGLEVFPTRLGHHLREAHGG